MAGDKFNIRANNWYRQNGANPASPANPLNELVAALAGGVAKVISGKYAATELITGNILSPGVGEMLNGQTPESGKPKAGLHWVLFDEQFGYVGNSSGNDFVGSDQECKPYIASSTQGYKANNIDELHDALQSVICYKLSIFQVNLLEMILLWKQRTSVKDYTSILTRVMTNY